jgi:hypothetical protein
MWVIFSKFVLLRQRITYKKKFKKKMTGSAVGLKRKRRPKNAQSQRKLRKLKDIFTDEIQWRV